MRAGQMREHLSFLEYTEIQTPSGAVKKEWVETYKCRGIFKRSSPVYDKDGVEARELYQGTTIYFIVRATKKIHERMRVRYGDFVYEIILIEPNHSDHTLKLQVKRYNE